MMRIIRRLLRAMLGALIRQTPASRREWARAMLAEADHIASDVAATRWMLGVAPGLLRDAFMHRAIGVPLGFAGAFLVVIVSMTAHDFLSNAMRVPLSMPLFFVVIPELVFATSIGLLWRRRRAAALGVAAGAAMLLTHATFHMLGR